MGFIKRLYYLYKVHRILGSLTDTLWHISHEHEQTSKKTFWLHKKKNKLWFSLKFYTDLVKRPHKF